MSLTAAQARGRIKAIASKNGADPITLLRIFIMERFLERVSLSQFKENFVIKGGILITSMVGVSMRSTMDIDTSVTGKDLNLESAYAIISQIASLNIKDNVSFEITDAEVIMDDMEYPGIRFHLSGQFEQMLIPIKIDISTGDAITPRAIKYDYTLLLEERKIQLFSYNIETILAEKIQTIIFRGRTNTRMRDFYDVFTLFSFYDDKIQIDTLKEAYLKTCIKRGTLHLVGRELDILNSIVNDDDMKNRWDKYREKYTYAKQIKFKDGVGSAKTLIQLLSN